MERVSSRDSDDLCDFGTTSQQIPLDDMHTAVALDDVCSTVDSACES